MELLFLWIYKNSVYEEEGFNFSPEYEFYMEKSVNGEYCIKENNSWKKRPNIFRDDIIENVTAIVGENGAGKTSLLRFLMNTNGSNYNHLNPTGKYKDYVKKVVEKDLSVMVIRGDNDVPRIYYNLKSLKNCTNYEAFSIDKSSVKPKGSCPLHPIQDFSRFYLTNSSWSIDKSGNIGTSFLDDKGSKAYLKPEIINTIAKMYFDNQLRNSCSDSQIVKKLNDLRWSILDQRNERFQAICDLIYFNKLFKDGMFNKYASKITTEIEISCQGRAYIPCEGKESVLFDNILEDKSISFVSANLYALLFREFITESANDIDNNSIKNKQDIVLTITGGKRNSYNSSISNKYRQAMSEIDELEDMLRTCSRGNINSDDDPLTAKGYIFDYNKDKKAYINILKYIAKCFNKNHSFVLTYLDIKLPYMSSGERAFNNLFCWMNLVPEFTVISSLAWGGLKESILLLFDELDLYLHPSWQINIISNLLEEIKRQFIGKKVQIIFATHSPLCLSDIPVENTVFLRYCKEKGKSSAEKRSMHKQSLARDVYSILNDSFYLGHNHTTMGSFASRYINDILNSIKEIKTHGQLADIQTRIDMIGNQAIQAKLFQQLERELNPQLKSKLEIHLLEEQRNIIDKKIAEKKGES